MKYRIFTFFTAALLVFNLGASSFAGIKLKKGANDLVSLLPASDGVVVFDSKRFFSDALPKLLANNPAVLSKVNAKVDELKTRIGIDIRDFDSVAVGVATRQLGEKRYDIDPVLIGRGQMSSAALVGAAKLAANGKYREERVGNRVMYIFDLQKVAASQTTGTFLDKLTEVAVAAVDDKAVAIGEIGRVRQTLEAKTRVGVDLVTMIEKSSTAVAAFAVKPPSGLRDFLPLDNDELGKNIDSIQYVYGNTIVAADNAAVHMTLRTQQGAQAKSLFETLEGLQMVGKAFLGASKSADKQVYARMIENAKFVLKGNEVMFDLAVPQSDIDILVGMIGS